MLLTFILFVIFLLHIQFYLRNIFFELSETTFSSFTTNYLFDESVARESLTFVTACTILFAIAYVITYRLGKFSTRRLIPLPYSVDYRLPLWPLVTVGFIQVVAMIIVVAKARLAYQNIAFELHAAGFVLELRVIFLLLLSHLLLNVRIRDVMRLRQYRWARVITYLYFLAVLLVQARSRIFELVAIIAFAHLMWHRDKPRLKYFIFLGFSLIAPNIIVLGRLGLPEDFKGFVDLLFSFEYTILFNNLLSAAITEGSIVGDSYTFSSSMGLMVPSPIREVFEIIVVKSDYYTELSQAAGIRNGGFSLLAELFSNFGWNAIWVFGCMGGMLGFLNSRAARVGCASLKTCVAPLLYVAFILAFRNDLGVFVKQVFQLFIIAFAMDLIAKVRIIPKNRPLTI